MWFFGVSIEPLLLADDLDDDLADDLDDDLADDLADDLDDDLADDLVHHHGRHNNTEVDYSTCTLLE